MIRVIAKSIALQNDVTENVTIDGCNYADEAKDPDVERANLDEGHIIANSHGGVLNAYNITPLDSSLNCNHNQAYM